MRAAPLTLAVGLATVAFAGCLTDSPDTKDLPDIPSLVSEGLSGPPNYQLTAHPRWGWPTLNNMGNLSAAWDIVEHKQLPSVIKGLTHVAHVEDGNVGSGIAIWGQYAFNSGGGGRGKGTVVDLSDPSKPVKVADIPDQPGTRDADMLAFPDGRVLLVTATNSMKVPVFDVTDPKNPYRVVDLETTQGSHNIAVVPGTPIVYNSNSNGGASLQQPGSGRTASSGVGVTEIFDLSVPEEPGMVKEWKNGFGCHDITFYINPSQQKYRAYCAGIEYTQIWDIADPLEPKVVVNVPVHYGAANGPSGEASLLAFAHLATVNHDASILIVGDETGGGALPGCDVYAHAGGKTISGPIGNLWFYDIRDERNPTLKGWVSPSSTLLPTNQEPGSGTSCTAHFGRIVEDRNLILMSFYGQGVALIDFKDPANPVILDQWKSGTNTWDVWYYQGYAVTGDTRRGMDILTFE